jgi:nicotinamide mononucleotide adenylyltransferase
MEENQSNEASQVEIQARLENRLSETRVSLVQVRDEVRNFFQTRYEENGFSEVFEITVDEVNGLLDDIGASNLECIFEGTVTLELSFRVHAENRTDAEDLIESHISDYGYDDGIIELSVDSTEIDMAG